MSGIKRDYAEKLKDKNISDQFNDRFAMVKNHFNLLGALFFELLNFRTFDLCHICSF